MRLLFCSLALLLATVIADEAPPPSTPSHVGVQPRRCVHVPAHECPAIDNQKNMTQCRGVDDKLVCCHIKSQYKLKESLGTYMKTSLEIKALHLRNTSLLVLNLTEFTTQFQHLQELSVTDGNISMIVGAFPTGVTCLNLSDNALTHIAHAALASLHNLDNLDIARNNLTELPALNSTLSDVWLDIAGTNQLLCSNIKETMKSMARLNRTLHFAHDNDTFCLLTTTHNWFNSTERVPLRQVEAFSKLQEECPLGCICMHKAFTVVMNQPPLWTASVDCSGQQLTDLPENLPLHTVSLNVSNNNISSLARLANDSCYQELREFYADNNQIPSIIVLEGSKFISGFDILALRGNAIRIIPTYILSNLFDEHSGIVVKLGHNRLSCDCHAALVTKVWLMNNRRFVTDYEEVMCDDPPGRLIDLDKNTVCTEQRVWTDYIYYIIAAEVALLVLLVAKVTYDYWVFKTAGYLPWPASKMPKLPCDWVFES